jgi:hypothetical protein
MLKHLGASKQKIGVHETMFSSDEYKIAVQEYHEALDALNYADPEFFDVVNARITATRSRLGALHASLKRELLEVSHEDS